MKASDPLSFYIDLLHPRSLKYLSDNLQMLVRGRLWLQVLIGMVSGLLAGMAMGPGVGWVAPDLAWTASSWLALPGQLFLALIQMIVIPLVFASIIRGISAAENVEQLQRLGIRVALYFVATTTVAITIGLAVALAIEPGRYLDSASVQATLGPAVKLDNAEAARPAFADLPRKLLTLLPSNPLSSMVENNMIQVVVFALVVGVALAMMTPKQSRPLLDLLGSLQEVCMTIVRWAMLLAPFAVFGLLAQLTAKLGLEALLGMAVYIATVLGGLLLMLGVYLLLVFFVARKSPSQFLRAGREVLLLAFSTSSSAAVMPLTIKTVEEKLGVRPTISQLIVPLGATVNMDGTALYQGVAAVFLAQVFGVDLGIGEMLLITVTAVGASIGAPATPGVGIVVLAMVLGAVGVPPAGVALIMGVDRILDMSRTAINVSGDMVASLVMDRWVGGARTAHEERRVEAEHERIRRETGEDLILDEE